MVRRLHGAQNGKFWICVGERDIGVPRIGGTATFTVQFQRIARALRNRNGGVGDRLTQQRRE